MFTAGMRLNNNGFDVFCNFDRNSIRKSQMYLMMQFVFFRFADLDSPGSEGFRGARSLDLRRRVYFGTSAPGEEITKQMAIFDPYFSVTCVIQWTLVIVNSVLSPILFTNERCSLFSM